MPVLAGTRIGRYTLIRPLGVGASSVVYLALDEGGRPYTVKLFQRHLRENARREAAMQVSGPNLGRTLEVTEFDGQPALIGRLIAGQPLFRFYQRRPALLHAPREFVQTLLDVLAALEAMHAAGLLHRDVKPANILVRAGGYATLMDHDLSGPIREVFRVPLRIGTEAFQSPEDTACLPLEPSSDLWSVGVLLYWGLRGELPSGEVMAGPSHLARLCALLLSPTPQQRPDAAQASAMLLEAARHDFGPQALPTT